VASSEPDAKPLHPLASVLLLLGVAAGLVWLAVNFGQAAWDAIQLHLGHERTTCLVREGTVETLHIRSFDEYYPRLILEHDALPEGGQAIDALMERRHGVREGIAEWVESVVGTEQPCWYDPDRPTVATLREPSTFAGLFYLVLVLALGLFFVGLLAAALGAVRDLLSR
jgi:hypothetical protein